MKLRQRDYPHPVMAPNNTDFSVYNFSIDINVDINRIKRCYEFQYNLNSLDESIHELLCSGHAKLGVHIESPLSMYREFKEISHESSGMFTLNSSDLRGNIEVLPMIIARKEILDYHAHSFSTLFNDIKFKLMTGDLLAVGKGQKFDADHDIDPFKNVSSIFTVISSKDYIYDIDYESDKIIILISEEDFRNYHNLKDNSNYNIFLANIILMPALVSVLSEIKAQNSTGTDYSGFDTKIWFRVLKKKLASLEINLDEIASFNISSASIANEILGDLTSASINNLVMLEGAI